MLRKTTRGMTALLLALCLALTLAPVTAIAEEETATPGTVDNSQLTVDSEEAATGGVLDLEDDNSQLSTLNSQLPEGPAATPAALAAEVGDYGELLAEAAKTYGESEITLGGTISGSTQLTIARSLTLNLNGQSLTITVTSGNGIKIANDATLTIKDTGGGTLTVTNKLSDVVNDQGAGINTKDGSLLIKSGAVIASGGLGCPGIGGGDGSYAGSGTITIDGGAVTANGGQDGSGIGSHNTGGDREITINGGTVTANGGASGAGIVAGKITINGGVVTAEGGAGIGCVGQSSRITINGGTVTATSTGNGSGIGGKNFALIEIYDGAVVAQAIYGAGIGHGSEGASPTGFEVPSVSEIIIDGGVVTAKSKFGAGIGLGFGGYVTADGAVMLKMDGDAAVYASSLTNGISNGGANTSGVTKGILFVEDAGSVYGDMTLADDLTVESGQELEITGDAKLTVPAGKTLTNEGRITNKGTIENRGEIYNSGGGVITNNGEVNNYGEIIGWTADGDVSHASETAVKFSKGGAAVTQAAYGETVKITATSQMIPGRISALSAAEDRVDFYRGDIATGTKLGTAIVSGGTAAIDVTLTGAGWTPDSYTVTADFGGAGTLLDSTGAATLLVTKATQTLTANNIEKYVIDRWVSLDGHATSDAGGIDKSGAITYRVEAEGTPKASIDEHLSLFFEAAGTATIGVKAAGSEKYEPAEKNFTLTVKPTPPVPGMPQDFAVTAGNGQVTATWNKPDDGGIVDGYVIMYLSAGSDTWESTDVIPHDPTSDTNGYSYTITGLDDGVEYSFIIFAQNIIGAGEQNPPSGGEEGSGVKATPGYTLTVDGGTSNKEKYAANELATVTAEVKSDKDFDGWTTEDGVTFADASAAVTTFAMPAKDVTVTANFKDKPPTLYELTVDGGTSNKEKYAANELATVTAEVKSDKDFDGWTTTDGVTFADASAAVTTFAMPAKDVTVTANFKDKPQAPVNPGGGTGGGSGSGGGGSDTSIPENDWLEPGPASTLANNAKKQNLGHAFTRRANLYGVRGLSWARLKGLRFWHDSVAGSEVKLRVYFDNPELFTEDARVSGYVSGPEVDKYRAFFEKWFSNKIRTIHFDHAGKWEQPVHIAAKVDLAGMDTSKLCFYYYDPKLNKYTRFYPEYWIDANGFLHFITEYAGEIIISEGELERK